MTAPPILVNGRVPAGVRNRNPTDLRWSSANNWRGQTGHDGEGFCTFDTDDNGLRAGAENALHGQTFHHLVTITQHVSRWAPPNENATAAYIKSVSKRMGIPPTAVCDLRVPAILHGFIVAVIWQEISQQPYPDAMIAQAVAEALAA